MSGESASASTHGALVRSARQQARRSFWLRQLTQWHWISAAISLIGMILFAATGITLNHASQIKTSPQVTKLHGELPMELRALLETQADAGGALPAPLLDWLGKEWSLRGVTGNPEWSSDELYVSMPRPGGDAWLSVDLASGEIEYERTDRGWISYFNDLHKGRNSGLVWSWFLDVFAVACLIFSISGLFLLQLHARRRVGTWPFVGLGLLLPLLLALLFIH